MTRPRQRAESGCYHVIIRGNGQQVLFEDDADRRAFLKMAENTLVCEAFSVVAWCLMENHVHLLVRDDDGRLSDTMRKLLSAFARYFNAKSGHTGHVLQGRFKSMPIENDAYLLEAVRYIHNNPEKAGICPAPEYPWSSYREYLAGTGLSEPGTVLEMLGGAEGFRKFSAEGSKPGYRFSAGVRIPDDEMVDVACSLLPGMNVVNLASLPKIRRDKALGLLRRGGLSVRQIARLTGLGIATIGRATKQP